MLRDFVRCVGEFEPMPVTVRDGLRTLEVVEACYRSVAENQPEFVSRPHRVTLPRPRH